MTERQEPNSGTATESGKSKTKRHRKKKSSKRKVEPHFSPATIKALKEHLLKDTKELKSAALPGIKIKHNTCG